MLPSFQLLTVTGNLEHWEPSDPNGCGTRVFRPSLLPFRGAQGALRRRSKNCPLACPLTPGWLVPAPSNDAHTIEGGARPYAVILLRPRLPLMQEPKTPYTNLRRRQVASRNSSGLARVRRYSTLSLESLALAKPWLILHNVQASGATPTHLLRCSFSPETVLWVRVEALMRRIPPPQATGKEKIQ